MAEAVAAATASPESKSQAPAAADDDDELPPWLRRLMDTGKVTVNITYPFSTTPAPAPAHAPGAPAQTARAFVTPPRRAAAATAATPPPPTRGSVLLSPVASPQITATVAAATEAASPPRRPHATTTTAAAAKRQHATFLDLSIYHGLGHEAEFNLLRMVSTICSAMAIDDIERYWVWDNGPGEFRLDSPRHALGKLEYFVHSIVAGTIRNVLPTVTGLYETDDDAFATILMDAHYNSEFATLVSANMIENHMLRGPRRPRREELQLIGASRLAALKTFSKRIT